MTIGEQIAESRRLHFGASRRQAREDALALLRQVGSPTRKTGSITIRMNSPAACASGR
jgi:ABC-type microcin C transport system duplicated ATPase subunit YejF